MNKEYYIPREKFENWALENHWLMTEKDVYITPNGVIVYITVMEGVVVDVKVTNNSEDF